MRVIIAGSTPVCIVFVDFSIAIHFSYYINYVLMVSCRHGVTVSTQDSESCDGGSNPPGGCLFVVFLPLVKSYSENGQEQAQ